MTNRLWPAFADLPYEGSPRRSKIENVGAVLSPEDYERARAALRRCQDAEPVIQGTGGQWFVTRDYLGGYEYLWPDLTWLRFAWQSNRHPISVSAYYATRAEAEAVLRKWEERNADQAE